MSLTPIPPYAAKLMPRVGARIEWALVHTSNPDKPIRLYAGTTTEEPPAGLVGEVKFRNSDPARAMIRRSGAKAGAKAIGLVIALAVVANLWGDVAALLAVKAQLAMVGY